MNKKTFVLHDESVNTYGFRMLTSGANLEEFKKNPVMLLNHNDWSLPIGRWENIRVEGTRILADAVFDEKDTRAVEVMNKVEGDFIRMASIGAWAPEQVSDAFDLQLPGQIGPTVTRWTVREASIVTIGANHNALAFYDKEGNLVELTDKADWTTIPGLKDTPNNNVITNNNNKMGQLTQILKLTDQATESDIVSRVNELIANSDRLQKENETLSAIVKENKEKQKQQEQTEAVALIDAAIKDGRIDAKAREQYISLFDKDFSIGKNILAGIAPRQSVTERIQSGAAQKSVVALKDKSWEELDREGKLMELKDNDPELYKEKFKACFGKEPNM
jgi:hypothetical protein